MPAAISAALLKKRGTGNMTMAQIAHYMEHKDEADKLAADLQEHVDAANEAERNAVTRIEEAEAAEAAAKEAQKTLAEQARSLDDAKAQFKHDGEVELAQRRKDKERCLEDRRKLDADITAFNEQRREALKAIEIQKDALNTAEAGVKAREEEAAKQETANTVEMRRLVARAAEIESVAKDIAAAAGKLVKE